MAAPGRELGMAATAVPELRAHRRVCAASAAGRRRRAPFGVRLALAAGLVGVAVALGLVLSRPPLVVAGSNGAPAHLAVAYTNGNGVACQSGETLPEGTQAVRVSLSPNDGPQVNLKAYSGSVLVTEGELGAGWGVDETGTIPVRRVAHTIHGARVCLAIGPTPEPLQINGVKVRTASGRTGVSLRMEYLRPGLRSWLSLASSIAQRMGVARAPKGAWVAYLAIAAMLAVYALAARLVLSQTARGERARRGSASRIGRLLDRRAGALRRIPLAAWTCALVACLSAACWSVLTPPFQAPDEPSHFAYSVHVAETGSLPNPNAESFSEEEDVVLRGLDQSAIEWHPEARTISSPKAQRQLQQDLSLPLNRSQPSGANVAASEPPLYYALETIPYYLGSWGTLLDQLELMRLLSALMGGLTALFTFLFVRELLPGARWAWTIGGLSAALFPLLGFTSGFVTPDAMLCAVSAAVFYCLARGFRRGLTRRLAIATGALLAAGLLTKLNFIGLVPGAVLGLLVLALRGERGQAPSRRRAFGSATIAVAIAAAPVCAYVTANVIEGHHTLGIVSSAAHLANSQSGVESPLADVAYIWQFYLPRLPGMTNYFPGVSTIRDIWFDRTVGLYGWLDTSFPVWVDNIALIPAGLIVLLALRTLISRRSALRRRLPELLVYVAICAGLMALIGQDGYLHRLSEPSWEQPRYLLPLLPLGAALVALAARGAGRRLGPAVGALIVTLFIAHDIFSQLLVVARYYT